jgi:hypothetical protein
MLSQYKRKSLLGKHEEQAKTPKVEKEEKKKGRK